MFTERPAAFKGRRGVLTAPGSLPRPQAPLFPIHSGALVSTEEKHKGEKSFLSLRCLLSQFPLWAAWIKKKHTHTFMFFPAKAGEPGNCLRKSEFLKPGHSFHPPLQTFFLLFLLISPQYINLQLSHWAIDEALRCSQNYECTSGDSSAQITVFHIWTATAMVFSQFLLWWCALRGLRRSISTISFPKRRCWGLEGRRAFPRLPHRALPTELRSVSSYGPLKCY